MSIVRLNRLTLAGPIRDKDAVLERLQALGCLHLLPLAPTPGEPELAPPRHAVEARRALRHLREVPDRRRQVREDPDFDLDATIQRVLDNRRRLREVSDRRDALRERLRELEPWGDFRLPSAVELAGRRLWFYCVPLRQMDALLELELPWQVVHRDNRQAWVAVVHGEEPPPGALPVPRSRTGALSLSEVRRRLEFAELALEEVLAERQALTRWIWLLSSHLARAEDQARLAHARTQTHDDDRLFLVQGWMPERAAPEIQAFADGAGLALLREPPGPGDAPPTLLDNPPALAAGQDLVGFYQMPAYRAWDPSRVLFFSFTAFFAMILSDAGYAAALGLLLGIGWTRLGRSATGRRLRILGAALTGAALLWGILVGSYFGVAPSPESFWGRLRVLDMDDFDSMMRLSVGIGVLHLVLANAEMAVIQRGRAAGRIALGWILVLLAGFAFWLGQDPALDWLARPGQVGLYGGLAWILLSGSDRPLDRPGAIAWRLLDGLRQLIQITQVFGDVLSYLRLFALGLASASLAITFNDLARQAAAELPGLGLLLALLILLIGHLLNLALSLMSGVVHGLRLNFIEFYNWSLSGEGYPFKPFKKAEFQE